MNLMEDHMTTTVETSHIQWPTVLDTLKARSIAAWALTYTNATVVDVRDGRVVLSFDSREITNVFTAGERDFMLADTLNALYGGTWEIAMLYPAHAKAGPLA